MNSRVEDLFALHRVSNPARELGDFPMLDARVLDGRGRPATANELGCATEKALELSILVDNVPPRKRLALDRHGILSLDSNHCLGRRR